MTHKLQVVDHAGQVQLQLTRPAQGHEVADHRRRTAPGVEIGRSSSRTSSARSASASTSDGQAIGSINAENWRAWDFHISTPPGSEVARINKTFAGLARAMFTTADNYVVQIHRPLEEPLRSLVVAAAVSVDTALKQDERGLSQPSTDRIPMSRFDPPGAAVRAARGRAPRRGPHPAGRPHRPRCCPPSAAGRRAGSSPVSPGVVAGTACVDETFRPGRLRALECSWAVDRRRRRRRRARSWPRSRVRWPSVLTAERTALNFLGHLSGIATLTRRFVDAAGPRPAGLGHPQDHARACARCEKAAVRAGGGANHRGNLSDWVMFKDNHLTVLGIDEAVRRGQGRVAGSHGPRRVRLASSRCVEALDAGADALLLDNMTPDEVRACVDAGDGPPRASGPAGPARGLRWHHARDRARRYAGDRRRLVSCGSLTNSAPVLDIGLDIDVV